MRTSRCQFCGRRGLDRLGSGPLIFKSPIIKNGQIRIIGDAFIGAHRVPIISAAARNNVPAVYHQSAFARDGGLLSYGVDFVDIWRRTAAHVDGILRGAKPGDLPVQFPTKFEMVVNLKTAKALGLAVPPSIMLRADEVIE